MTGVTRVWSQTGKEVLGAKLWVMTLSAGLKGWEGKRGVSGGIFDKGGVKTGRLARRPGGLPRASHSNCRRPQFHQEESGSLALPPPPSPFLPGVRREAPHLRTLSLSPQLSCEKQGRRLPTCWGQRENE